MGAPTTSARPVSSSVTSSDLHGHTGYEAGRGRRRRSCGAQPVAHGAGAGQQPDADPGHQAAGGRRKGLRRPRGAWWRSNRRPAASSRWCRVPTFDPNLRRWHRSADWDLLNNSPDQADDQPADQRRLPAGFDFKPFMALGRWNRASAPPSRRFPTPGSSFRRPPVPRRQKGGPRHGRHVKVDRHSCDTYYMPRQRHGHRRHFRFSWQSSVSASAPASTSNGESPAPAFAGMEEEALQASRSSRNGMPARTISIGIGRATIPTP